MARSKLLAQLVESVRKTKPKFSGRILARLIEAEWSSLDPWSRDDCRIAYLTVLYAARNHPQPHVEATYRVLGIHPGKVFAAVTARRKAMMGHWYEVCYDEHGNWKHSESYEFLFEKLPPKKPVESVRLEDPVRKKGIV